MGAVYRNSATNERTILVVEDEVLIRIDLADYLRDCGYRVCEAANADEALAILQSGERVDLVLTDVQMPGSMDGFALARWVRDNHPGMKVLLTSGVSRSADLAGDLCEEGPIETKPYDPKRLAARIRAKLDQVRGPDTGRSRAVG
jgi:CheY-like chemotaxis protein